MSEKNIILSYEGVSICRKEHLLFKGLDLTLREGDFAYLIGPIGSGKSSLLKTIYAELPIAEGLAFVINYNLRRLKRRKLPFLRRKLGIVFQDFQMLSDRNVYNNLDFVLRAIGWKNKSERKARIEEVLEQVSMGTKSYKMPHELSGGEQQRISIARALLGKPQLILADEPTANLDSDTAVQIVQLLKSISDQGTAVLMSTHNRSLLRDVPAPTYAVMPKDGYNVLVEQAAMPLPSMEDDYVGE